MVLSVDALGMKREQAKATELAAHFEEAGPEALLRWVARQYADRWVLACAFGPESLILIDMLSRMQPVVRAFFIDTDFHFPKTLALKDEILERYPTLRLEVLKPRLTVAEQDASYGEALNKTNPDQCCFLRKVEPLQRALQGHDCWLSGLRREHAPTRAQTPMVQWDWQRDMLKVNPLVHWSKSQVWRYILDHEIPYNQLHDEGYPSIGCAPCTRPVTSGSILHQAAQDDRSGRWFGTTKVECGLHL
ncbi:phosphoadenylyl-sulfate reductase [Anthocerotibacter panamensis]|uniref:phosphoadenylyl-sulfate reductase n=1 Tax=Anthocerotibacter panamensis TaxID=2857077 RepID=UPI001C406334|nr:phosphoadenylyl-sulfate reductase [Anthocerotibacter panamensis]